MTKKQHSLYFREWRRAFEAHWTGVVQGEAVAKPGRTASAIRDRVVAAAQRLAVSQPDGRLTPDLLRRGCHLVATGAALSSYALRNKQLDQVLAVFRSLAQEEDLGARLKLEAAEAERARRVQAGRAADAGNPLPDAEAAPSMDRTRGVYAIRHCGLSEAYLAEIARDKFGTRDWASLPDAQLRQMLITCKARAMAKTVAADRRATRTEPFASTR